MNPTKPTAAAMRAADDIRGEINRGNLVITREEIALIIDREFAEVVEAARRVDLYLHDKELGEKHWCSGDHESRCNSLKTLNQALAKLKE